MTEIPDTRRAIEGHLRDLRSILAKKSHLPALEAVREKYQRELSELLERSRQAEKTLVILLLGGTGVGKSTVMNALAHEDVAGISRAERAFTKRLNLYHHEETSVLALTGGLEDGFERHAHRADNLRDKVIIDAPDIDSIETAHRALVARFLPRVDLVLYVTTLEKYKNRDACEFLKSLKGKHFFMFLLNQIDRVRPEDQAELLNDFRASLGRFGFEAPRVLGISARAVLEPGESYEFKDLEATIRNKIRAAEIAVLKQNGLIAKLETLVKELSAAVAPIGGTIDDFAHQLTVCAERLRTEREALRSGILCEMEALVAVSRERYEKRYHELRDRDANGPYGVFLRVHGFLSGNPIGAPSGSTSGLESHRRKVKIHSMLSSASSRSAGELRKLLVDERELDLGKSDELCDALIASAHKAADDSYLGSLPPPRDVILVNVVPTLTLAGSLVVFLYLAAQGKDPGVVLLLVLVLLFVTVCYAQFSILRGIDSASFRALIASKSGFDPGTALDSSPFMKVLVDTHARVQEEGQRVEGLAKASVAISSLEREVFALPDEIRT